jgi:hypothetical protein
VNYYNSISIFFILSLNYTLFDYIDLAVLLLANKYFSMQSSLSKWKKELILAAVPDSLLN